MSAEKRQDNGRVYFVNHNTRTTQWDDPRTQGWDCEPVKVLTSVHACVCLLVRWYVAVGVCSLWRRYARRTQLCFPPIRPGILWNFKKCVSRGETFDTISNGSSGKFKGAQVYGNMAEFILQIDCSELKNSIGKRKLHVWEPQWHCISSHCSPKSKHPEMNLETFWALTWYSTVYLLFIWSFFWHHPLFL